jgi:hypothetical protein
VALEPVFQGLDRPLFVTHAGDGSGRLFVLERGGRIRAGLPGGGPPAVFLDLSDRVATEGERGLLGLAFHPGFAQNRRFFVHYNAVPDGRTVIAEFRASASDPGVAEPAETVLLTASQPFGNHNGGSIEFGPDGFLYIGVGDGGSGFDPGNRAQDPFELLGKILRIDVDQPAGGLPYSSPPGNPFVGTGQGRPEVFALGFRNPYRFAFDRGTGALLVADVGQDEREEVNLVVAGGNYGWRVLEGTRCTGAGPADCDDPVFLPPVTEYHSGGGRCAVIGGPVYRGSAGVVPDGTYLFADFCSGEILTWRDGAHSVLLLTGGDIVALGEDEGGEVHVVDLGGTVSRLVAAGEPGPRAALSVSRLLLRPGDPVRLAARLENPGPAGAADVYLGAVLADGQGVVFVTTLAPLAVATVPLDAPAAFVPLAPAFLLDAGLDLTVPDVVAFTFTGAELPAGASALFVALGRPGTRVDLLSFHPVVIHAEP